MDDACTYETLQAEMEKGVDVAILLGHGNENTFTGRTIDGQEIIFRACDRDEVMSGTISHFLSCLVGQELLPDIITKNGVWTVGYADTFDFMIDPVEAEEPFREITLAIIRKILDGGTLKEVWEAGIAKGEEWIDRLWGREETWVSDAISLIEHDIKCMVGLGDKEAYVLPPRKLALAPEQAILLGLIFLLLTGKG